MHITNLWTDGSNNEGTQLDILFHELGLTQLISEPTTFASIVCLRAFIL